MDDSSSKSHHSYENKHLPPRKRHKSFTQTNGNDDPGITVHKSFTQTNGDDDPGITLHKSFTQTNDDDPGITVQSRPPPPKQSRRRPRKRNFSKENKDNTAGKTISSWRKLHEIDVLKSILGFYNKNGTYPFDDPTHMQNFYKNWIEKRGVYVDEDVFTNKLVDLPERFFKNQQNILMFGGKIQDWMDCWMDQSDQEIYRLSSMIWGNIDDDNDDD